MLTHESEYRMLLVEKEQPKEDRPETKKSGFEKTELDGIIFGLRVNSCDMYNTYKVVERNYINKGIHINLFKVLKIKNEYALKIKLICKTDIEEYHEPISIKFDFYP